MYAKKPVLHTDGIKNGLLYAKMLVLHTTLKQLNQMERYRRILYP